MKKSKHTEDQIVKILREAETGQTSHVELCKRHGIGIQTFYIWRRKYNGLQTDDLRRLPELEAENAALRGIVAEPDAWIPGRGITTSSHLKKMPRRFSDGATVDQFSPELRRDSLFLGGRTLSRYSPSLCRRRNAGRSRSMSSSWIGGGRVAAGGDWVNPCEASWTREGALGAGALRGV